MQSKLARNMGRNIRRLRMRKEWSLSQLGDAAGYARNTIWDFERGISSPSADGLPRIASALDVEVGDLYAEVSA